MKRRKQTMGVEIPNPGFSFKKKPGGEGNPPETPRRQRSLFESVLDKMEKATGSPPPAPAPTSESRMRPGYQERLSMPSIDPERWFKVGEIWTQVHNTVLMAGNQSYIVDTITLAPVSGTPQEREVQSAGEIAQFFGIPIPDFQGLTMQQAWQDVIGPLFDKLETAMNRVKPFGIPGSIRFELDPRGSLIMVYRDR